MESSTQRLFERVSQKLGWDRPGALDQAAEELRMSLKSRRDAVTSSGLDLPHGRELPSDGDSSEKENQDNNGEAGVNRFLQDSSDDEFDQILAAKWTPKPESKPTSRVQSAFREPVTVLSSDSDDDEFEKFLTRVKTPKAQPRPQTVSGTDDSHKHFIVDDSFSDDDFIVEKKATSIRKAKPKTPQSVSKSEKPPRLRFDSPVFVSDSDDDSDILIKSTWRSRHSGPSSEKKGVPLNKPQMTVHVPSPLALMHTPAPFSAPPTRTGWREESGSSEEEFQSLIDRIRKNQKAGSNSTYASPKPPEPKVATACVTPSVRREEGGRVTVKDPNVDKTPLHVPIGRPVCQTEPRQSFSSRVAVCKTPGCFLQSLSYPDSVYSRNFKQNKEELTSKLFRLYNTTVFDSKLPADMSIKWNTKMRKTAGYCITGQEKIKGTRYARIELSVKVCDSADRLRDTLVHEMCHAATWLINNVRDGHGPFWKIYARKATLMHPELPMVTRCHSYDINYKFQYQCNRCKNTIGRHSKSLDTQKFVCALCTGQLVLLTPSKPRAPTPFATFVKENYGTVRQELAGRSHADVMRKLSTDFASKTRLSQS